MDDDLRQLLVGLPPDDLTTPPGRVEHVFARARRARRLRVAATGSAALLVAAGAILGLIWSSGGDTQRLQEVSPPGTITVTPPVPATPVASASATPAVASPGRPRFIPQSVSFTDAEHGYAWGPAHWPTVDGAPGVLATTADGGRTWRAVPSSGAPRYGGSQGADQVLFTDADHGLLAGDRLYRTDDGGRHWQAVPAPGRIVLLRVVGSHWYAVACVNSGCTSQRLYEAATDAASFQPVTAIPPWGQQGAVLADAGAAFYMLVEGGEPTRDSATSATLWRTVDDGRSWTHVPAPCDWFGSDFAALSAYSPSGLALVCGSQPAAGNQVKIAYRSSDAGASWTRRAQLPGQGGYVGSLAAADTNTWVLGQLRGGLLTTRDGGLTWTPAENPGSLTAPVEGWGHVERTGPQHFVAVPWTLNAQVLAISADAGETWTEVAFSVASDVNDEATQQPGP